MEFESHRAYLWLLAHPDWLAASIVLIAFVESFAIVGVAVPGVVLLTITAFLAGSGLLALHWALLAAFVGAVLGDGCSFLIGHANQGSFRSSRLLSRQADWIARGERFFQRYGLMSIIIGRFIGPIRPVMPLVAGLLGMSRPAFFTINGLSALAWAPAYILPGFALGASLDIGLSPLQLTGLCLLALGLILGLFWLIRHYFKF